jgi:hypothetical protein
MKSRFVLILDINNITRAITPEKVKAEKYKRDPTRKNFTQLCRRYLDPGQGERDVDPSSALAS